MSRISILKAEIEALEIKKNTQDFMKMLNNEKFDAINEQLEIIKKQLEIIRIILQKEYVSSQLEEILGQPPEVNNQQQEILRLLKENEHKLSPTVLGLYNWSKEEEKPKEVEKNIEKVEIIEESNVKVNIESYLALDNDSDYENDIIGKLQNLNIEDKSVEPQVDVKPNVPVVVPQPKLEEVGSTSGTKWYKDPEWEDSYVSQDGLYRTEESYQSNPRRKYIDRRQYFMKRNDTIPMRYTPYDKEPLALTPTGIYLDLDCVEDKDKIITQWIKENSAVAIKEAMSKEQTIEFMRRTMKGNVEKFIESSNEIYEGIKTSSSNATIFISNLEKLIRQEFLGHSITLGTEERWEIERQDALGKLVNINICNMCYFDQYTCEFSELFYKARISSKEAEYRFYGRLYYEKLPEPFKSKITEDLEEFLNKQNFSKDKVPSLGLRISFAQRKISDYCLQAKSQKQIYKYQKQNLCCSKNTKIGQYGCNIKGYKRKKKKY